MNTQKLSDKLTYSKKSVYERDGKKNLALAMEYAEKYKSYLDAGKTERECVKISIALAEAAGYTEYKLGEKIVIKVNGTDKISRTIDFVIPQDWELEEKDNN